MSQLQGCITVSSKSTAISIAISGLSPQPSNTVAFFRFFLELLSTIKKIPLTLQTLLTCFIFHLSLSKQLLMNAIDIQLWKGHQVDSYLSSHGTSCPKILPSQVIRWSAGQDFLLLFRVTSQKGEFWYNT